MTENARKGKTSSNKTKFYVQPTDRLDILAEMARDRQLKDADIRLAVELLRRRNNQTGQLDPSKSRLAKDLGWSLSKVEKSIARLAAEGGWVRITNRWHDSKTQDSNQYDFDFERLNRTSPRQNERGDPVTIDGGTPSALTGSPPSLVTVKPGSEVEPREPEPNIVECVASNTDAPAPNIAGDNNDRWPVGWPKISDAVTQFLVEFPPFDHSDLGREDTDHKKLLTIAFGRARSAGVTWRSVMTGLARYKTSLRKSGTTPEFTLSPTKYAQGECWDDGCPVSGNDNRASSRHKASGDDWEEPPF
jgi:hypothetical protein